MPGDLEIVLEGCRIKPDKTVKLLGIAQDHNLTLAPQIDGVIKKCQGLRVILKRAAAVLRRELLRLTYIALIRSQLEYASALYMSTAPSHVKKLEIV